METAVVDENVKVVGKIDDVIYPMYMPKNTKLINLERVTKENGEKLFLRFQEIRHLC